MKCIKNYIGKYVDQLVFEKIYEKNLASYNEIAKSLHYLEISMEKVGKNLEKLKKENEK